jgi:tRNA G46 methylase TrmB
MIMRSFKPGFLPVPRLLPDLSEVLAHPRVDVEIGAGQGLHAIRYAAENPDRRLIAVERTLNRFRQLERRRREHPGLENLFPVHADALSVFVHALPDRAVERVFLLYPNPYPKEKQANLRWHNMPFMDFLKQKLKPGGRLILATNERYYAEEAERKMTAEWRFELGDKRLLGCGDRPRTHFEKKYLERGESCWNMVFVNTGSGA